MFQKFFVEIFATKHGVSVRCFDFEDTTLDFQDRNIERSTTQIEHDDGLTVGLVHTVRKRRRRRFVDDPQHVQSGNLSCILRGLTLTVIEVRGDSNDSLRNGPSQKSFRGFFHLTQDHRPDL
mmetsp:Transcript_46707/g.113819  ORF Transcript_46707/g.113819 Transcript_46707/m.113819 type:complete len:122 (-) Transcript_46707:554-919(-)